MKKDANDRLNILLGGNMKPIKDYEGLYSITKEGEIYSHISGKFVNGWINTNGYKMASMKGKRIYVHRLMATTYIENPKNKRTVNHKDGNKLNNNLENLEWATDSEQHKHSWKLGLEKVTDNFTQEKNRVIPKEKTLLLIEDYKNKRLQAAKEAISLNVTVAAIYNSIYRGLKSE